MKRPNEKYKLSKEKPDPVQMEELNFYYNRERRLEKAPAIVRQLYERPKHKFNLLKPLVGDRPRATLFFTIVGFCIFILVISFLGLMGKTYLLEGNRLQIEATRIDDVSLIVIKKKIVKNGDPYTGRVEIVVSPVTKDEEYRTFRHSIDFSLQDEERYGFTVPFNDPKLVVHLETEKSSFKRIIVKTE